MKNLKFRVWNQESKKFRRSEYLAIGLDGKLIEHITSYNDDPGDCWDDSWNAFDVSGIISQFTGFLDKNGNEIYDEDIVSINGDNFLVVWQNDGFWCFHDLKNKVTIEPWKITNYCGKENKKNFELVGNRCESEHLLNIE